MVIVIVEIIEIVVVIHSQEPKVLMVKQILDLHSLTKARKCQMTTNYNQPCNGSCSSNITVYTSKLKLRKEHSMHS